MYYPTDRIAHTTCLCYISRAVDESAAEQHGLGRPVVPWMNQPLNSMVWGAPSCRGAAGLYSIPSNSTVSGPKYVELLKKRLKQWRNYGGGGSRGGGPGVGPCPPIGPPFVHNKSLRCSPLGPSDEGMPLPHFGPLKNKDSVTPLG